MTITIPAFADRADLDFEVARPTRPREDLIVQSCERTIASVIEFIRHHGFDESPDKRCRGTGTIGVWTHQNGYVTASHDETKKWKIHRSLDDAIAYVQMGPPDGNYPAKG